MDNSIHVIIVGGSVTFWSGSGSVPLMDPDPVPDPDSTPDPTPFFHDFKDAKKIIFFKFFF